MSRNTQWNRRTAAKAAGAAAIVGALGATLASAQAEEAAAAPKGRVKQSLCRWCYGGIPLEKLPCME